MSSALLFSKIFWLLEVLLRYCMNFSIVFLISVKRYESASGSMDFANNINSNSSWTKDTFSNVLWFSVCKSFASLVNFFHKYFILLYANLTGITLNCLLGLFVINVRKLKFFCMLILYTEISLNSFVISNFLVYGHVEFSTYYIMSSMNRDNFTSFLVWTLLPNCSG
jgi:hypothetical protein